VLQCCMILLQGVPFSGAPFVIGDPALPVADPTHVPTNLKFFNRHTLGTPAKRPPSRVEKDYIVT
jgi:hypothetical protein